MKILLNFILILCFSLQLFSQSLNDELFKKAENHFKRRAYDKARIIYENLLKEKDFKKRELLLFHLGSSYHSLRKRENAYQVLTKLLEEFPQTAFLKKSLRIMVDYLKQKKEFDKAVELLENYLNKFKNDIEIKKLILDVYEANEDYSKALHLLEKDIPRDFWFVKKKADYLKKIKEYDRAIEFIKSQLPEYDKIEMYMLLAGLYEIKKDFSNSALWYEKSYNKSKKIIYLFNGARMLLSNNAIEESRTVINKIIEILGHNVKTYKQIADIYKEFGMYDELLVLYNDAIKKGFDFEREKISVYEIMGKYETAIYSYCQMLNKTNYFYVLQKLENLILYEEQFPLTEKLLIEYENKFPAKKGLILQLQMQIYLKFDQLSKLINVLKAKYFPLNNIDNIFLETLMNSLFSRENYEYIIDIYKLIPLEIKKNINPAIKLRYAQSLYIFKKYDLSLQILNTLKQEVLLNTANYYKALNYVELKKYPEALQNLKGLKNYEAFNLNLKILILKGEIKQAEKMLSRELKKKNFPKSDLTYNEIIIELFLNEDVLLIQDIKKYLQIYPQNDKANDLAFMLFLLNNDLIKNNKENKTAVMDFFKYYNLGDFKQSIVVFKKLKFNIENIDSIINYYISKCYLFENDYDTAINELNIIISKETFVKPYALELLGWTYHYKKKNPELARKYFKQVLSDYPSFVNINNIRKILTN